MSEIRGVEKVTKEAYELYVDRATEAPQRRSSPFMGILNEKHLARI